MKTDSLAITTRAWENAADWPDWTVINNTVTVTGCADTEWDTRLPPIRYLRVGQGGILKFRTSDTGRRPSGGPDSHFVLRMDARPSRAIPGIPDILPTVAGWELHDGGSVVVEEVKVMVHEFRAAEWADLASAGGEFAALRVP